MSEQQGMWEDWIFPEMEIDVTNNPGSEAGESDLVKFLEEGRKDLQKNIRELESKLLEVKTELDRAKQQLEHLDGFLTLEQGRPIERVTVHLRSSSKQVLGDLVEEVLRERKGEPMHYTDLAREIMERGAVIRGKNPANGLVSRIHDDDRFVRPERRGFYALKEDFPDAESVGIRKGGQTIDNTRVFYSGVENE